MPPSFLRPNTVKHGLARAKSYAGARTLLKKNILWPFVIPRLDRGIQLFRTLLDPCFRRDDVLRGFFNTPNPVVRAIIFLLSGAGCHFERSRGDSRIAPTI